MTLEERMGKMEARVSRAEELTTQLKKENADLKLKASEEASQAENYRLQLVQVSQEYQSLKENSERFTALKKTIVDLIAPDLKSVLMIATGGQAVHGTLETTQFNIKVTPAVTEVKTDDKTTRGRILYLGSKGFFKVKRQLNEIIKALQDEGWPEDTNSVKGRISELANEGILRKISDEHRHSFYWITDNVMFS